MRIGDWFYLFSVEVVNESGKLLKRIEFCDSIEAAAEAAKKYEHNLKKNQEIWFVPYRIGQTKSDIPELECTYTEHFDCPYNNRYTKSYFESVKRSLRWGAPKTGYSKYWPMVYRMEHPQGYKNNRLSAYIFTGDMYNVVRHSRKDFIKDPDDKIVPPNNAVCTRCWNNVKHCECRPLPTIFANIDEHIQPTIIELNRKGYITDYCCEGHSWNGPNAYISFGARYKFPIPFPEYWYDDGTAIRLNYKSAVEGNESFEEVKIRKMKELEEWARSLPERTESFRKESKNA